MNVRDLEKAIGKIDEELAELREKRMLIVKERNELRDKEPRKVNKADNNPLYNYTNWVKTGVTNRGKYPSARNKKYLPAYYNSEGIKLEIFDKYGRCDNALLKKWKEERELWEKRMQENEDKEKEISGIIKKKEKLRDKFIDDYERLSYLVNMDLNEIGRLIEINKQKFEDEKYFELQKANILRGLSENSNVIERKNTEIKDKSENNISEEELDKCLIEKVKKEYVEKRGRGKKRITQKRLGIILEAFRERVYNKEFESIKNNKMDEGLVYNRMDFFKKKIALLNESVFKDAPKEYEKIYKSFTTLSIKAKDEVERVVIPCMDVNSE